MAKLDIEEKFKKDISKEVANLKEFLISQGKEIVKLKQENKVLNIQYLRERPTSCVEGPERGKPGKPAGRKCSPRHQLYAWEASQGAGQAEGEHN